jgi:hypothetical protein
LATDLGRILNHGQMFLLEARFNQNRPGAWERHKMLEKA